jgi:5-methylcytosine-specific restriction endonuclease McrA
MMKQCTKCAELKPLDCFEPEKRGYLGTRADCRACRAEYKRQHRAKPEVKEAISEYRKRYNAANEDAIKAYAARYRDEHREERRIKTREWWQANPERGRALIKKRRAIKAGVPHERVTIGYLFERDNGVCQLCRKRVDRGLRWPHPMAPVADHIVPIILGGHDTKANQQLAHNICNSRKHVKAVGEQLRLIG